MSDLVRILLRDLGSYDAAAQYAERMAHRTWTMYLGLAPAYVEAADEIRRLQADQNHEQRRIDDAEFWRNHA